MDGKAEVRPAPAPAYCFLPLVLYNRRNLRISLGSSALVAVNAYLPTAYSYPSIRTVCPGLIVFEVFFIRPGLGIPVVADPRQ